MRDPMKLHYHAVQIANSKHAIQQSGGEMGGLGCWTDWGSYSRVRIFCWWNSMLVSVLTVGINEIPVGLGDVPVCRNQDPIKIYFVPAGWPCTRLTSEYLYASGNCSAQEFFEVFTVHTVLSGAMIPLP
eukprot:1158907-Pelagomonas_calceolata.AAC.5